MDASDEVLLDRQGSVGYRRERRQQRRRQEERQESHSGYWSSCQEAPLEHSGESWHSKRSLGDFPSYVPGEEQRQQDRLEEVAEHFEEAAFRTDHQVRRQSQDYLE